MDVLRDVADPYPVGMAKVMNVFAVRSYRKGWPSRSPTIMDDAWMSLSALVEQCGNALPLFDHATVSPPS